MLVGGRPIPLAGTMQRGLLAALLLYGNRTVPISHLNEALWATKPPRTAKAGLQWQISRLRKLLDNADPDGERLRFQPPGYILRVEPAELDSDRFATLAASGSTALAQGDLERADRDLRAATGMWNGKALEDAEAPRLARERDRWHTIYMAALEDRLEVDLRFGRHYQLLGELDELVSADPLRERLRAFQMLALYRSGDPAGAVRVFHECRNTLVEELGLEPGEELQRLLRSVLNRETQLDLPSGNRAIAPVQVPAELPADIPSFTGREFELAALDTLRSGGEDLQAPIALSGPAGAGKTATVIRWAHRNIRQFPDGQLFADMRGHCPNSPVSPLRILTRFLHTLGLPRREIPDCPGEAASLYRTMLSNRKMLIILDDVYSAEQVRPLVPGHRSSLLVLTSRHRLSGLQARDGFQHLGLRGLSTQDSQALMERLLGSERVAAEPENVARLNHLCSGLPLALRIAATRLRRESPGEVGDLLNGLCGVDGLRLLEVGQDAGASVRVSLDRSYTRLRHGEQQFFKRLGRGFPQQINSCSIAAESAMGEVDSGRLLASLAEASMILPMAPDQYEMPDLIRLYAQDKARRESQPSETTMLEGADR
ncbi:NB-ARC domain-containing protein [Streptomyces uncialis]|uniref:AfsR/SARP family transcriptional regulator n=1 Tax=Streptomyces uncialis TaxID=1048205 RepID=UPI002E32E726|nr:BTAD domain-containing putative transcriptional regulator [Streptomyces uncialis]